MAPRPDRGVRAASSWRDVAVVAAAAVLAGLLAAAFNVSERLASYSRGWEGLQLDELPLVLLVLVAGLLVVAERRRRLALRELRARREAESRLAAALTANRELSQEHLRQQEAERRRLARELHDELGQYLNAIKLDVVSLRQAAGDAGAVAETARQIVASLDHAHAAVGGMIARLRPAALDDLGLQAALEACVGAWQRRLPQVEFSFDCSTDLEHLGESLNVAAYRLVQEGLTNAVRHSGASRVTLSVRRLPSATGCDVLHLRIADEGKGARPADLTRGFGLRGMRERVDLQGGRLVVDTAPGRGFTLDIDLPIGGDP